MTDDTSHRSHDARRMTFDEMAARAQYEWDRAEKAEAEARAMSDRATRLQQERDEAYERAAKVADKKADDLLVTGARLGAYSQATKPAYTEAELHEQAGTAIRGLAAAIRRLAAGDEKENL